MNTVKPFDRYMSVVRMERDFPLMVSINNSNAYLQTIEALFRVVSTDTTTIPKFLEQYACAMNRVPDFIALLDKSRSIQPSKYFIEFFDPEILKCVSSTFFSSSPIAFSMSNMRVDVHRLAAVWASVTFINLMLPMICAIRQKYAERNQRPMSYKEVFFIIESFLRENFPGGLDYLFQTFKDVNPHLNSEEHLYAALLNDIGSMPLNHAAYFNMLDLDSIFKPALREGLEK